MDPYHALLDMWLEYLPAAAHHVAFVRCHPRPCEVTPGDVDEAVRQNLKHARLDAQTFGVGMIEPHNQALLDAGDVIKSRLGNEARDEA